MRLNGSKQKKVKRWLAAAGFFLCLMGAAVPVYAEEETAVAAQEETGAQAEQEKKAVTDKAEEKELTLPVGNLTLVDDVISASDGHREFLTVVSREGSYFYIVIDRDTQGAGNVYFLNLVDEQDLYKLTGEEAPAVEASEENPQITLEPQTESQGEKADAKETEKDTDAAQKKKSLMITVAVGAGIAVVAVIYILKKRKGKKQAATQYDLTDFDDEDE